MHDIAAFLSGFRQFQKDYFCLDGELFEQLRRGQTPKAMVVACSDSRVDPALLTGSGPGDLFVVRNVANLIPPYAPDESFHGVSAALEYGVTRLGVEHLIVLGHSRCGGVRALLDRGDGPTCGCSGKPKGEFIDAWVGIAEPALVKINETMSHKPIEVRQRALEQAAILVSLENCLSFPWIRARVEAGTLILHGWWFDLDSGDLFGFLPQTGVFEPLIARCTTG